MEKSPHLQLAKIYWQKHLQQNHLAIDATCGNGHDTLFLAELCEVVGFDIQDSAIQNTKALLEKNGRKATLHHLCHEKIDEIALPQAPRLVVYNLGYLPSGDKNKTTKKETTLASVQKAMGMIEPGGAICITCYPGHDEGEREEKALLSFIEMLPSTRWHVCYHKWINRPRSPTLLWLMKE